MSTHTHVPADDDATSILSLVEDCREVSGVLAPYLPVEIRLPDDRAAQPVEIDAAVAAGWGEY